jgi:hypothetical protein
MLNLAETPEYRNYNNVRTGRRTGRRCRVRDPTTRLIFHICNINLAVILPSVSFAYFWISIFRHISPFNFIAY